MALFQNTATAGDDDDDDDDRSPNKPAFSKYPSDLCLAFDPQVGFALIGAHQPGKKEPARLQAFDPYNQRVAWQALVGTAGVETVEDDMLAVRGRNVYVSIGRSLHTLDLFTGQSKWGSEFTDRLKDDSAYGINRGLQIIDATPDGQRGALLALGVDDTITSLDRDTGQLLWRENRERMPRRITPLGPSGLLVIEGDQTVVIHPSSSAPVFQLSKRPSRADIVGQFGIWQVENWDWRDREGLALFDYVANKELMFEAVEKIEDDVPSVMGHGRIFCALESGAKLFGAPQANAVVLREGFHIRSLLMGGPTLFVLLEKHHGTDYRRILGVDPQTLGIRFDLGELSTEPDDNWTGQMCTNGELTVIVTSRDDDDDHCELWGVNSAGQVLWKTYVGEWRGHYFLGGHIIAYASSTWHILRPNDGQTVATYPPQGR